MHHLRIAYQHPKAHRHNQVQDLALVFLWQHPPDSWKNGYQSYLQGTNAQRYPHPAPEYAQPAV